MFTSTKTRKTKSWVATGTENLDLSKKYHNIITTRTDSVSATCSRLRFKLLETSIKLLCYAGADPWGGGGSGAQVPQTPGFEDPKLNILGPV